MGSLRVLVFVAALSVVWGCGGGSGSSSVSAPTSPSATTPAPSAPASVTVNIVSSTGTNSYVPNPVSVGSGSTVVFKNSDSTLHHIVMDDGSADVGDIAPGASSRALTLKNGPFHCTLHPTMVGSINGSLPAPSPEPPPPSAGYRAQ